MKNIVRIVAAGDDWAQTVDDIRISDSEIALEDAISDAKSYGYDVWKDYPPEIEIEDYIDRPSARVINVFVDISDMSEAWRRAFLLGG